MAKSKKKSPAKKEEAVGGGGSPEKASEVASGGKSASFFFVIAFIVVAGIASSFAYQSQLADAPKATPIRVKTVQGSVSSPDAGEDEEEDLAGDLDELDGGSGSCAAGDASCEQQEDGKGEQEDGKAGRRREAEPEEDPEPKKQWMPKPDQPNVTPPEGWPECPTAFRWKKSEGLGSENVGVFIKNTAAYDVNYYWVDFQGKERLQSVIGRDETRSIGSFPGHLFRFRGFSDKRFILDFQVPKSEEGSRVTAEILPCGDATNEMSLWRPGREAEFEALVSKDAFDCVGDSRDWSCIHHVSKEEENNRDPGDYGYHEGEEGRRKVGVVDDSGYIKHIKTIIPVTGGSGLLLMNMTDKMKDMLFEWYNKEIDTGGLTDHEVVSGGYTNSHVIQIEKLNLDKYPEIHNGIVNEMREVLQWWTEQRLKHTSTFGLRLYKRGSMLINHIDRMDTHLASAVLQVSQHNIDEGGGWPLEVLVPPTCVDTEEAPCHRAEVYMQPGEMVLYEGARIMHGRPMRLRGEAFGNVFTHFAPIDWNGPSVDSYSAQPRKRRRKKKEEL